MTILAVVTIMIQILIMIRTRQDMIGVMMAVVEIALYKWQGWKYHKALVLKVMCPRLCALLLGGILRQCASVERTDGCPHYHLPFPPAGALCSRELFTAINEALENLLLGCAVVEDARSSHCNHILLAKDDAKGLPNA